jgi:hypothetical protein
MAKVPDLGSDFAQKLLKDLRRRRERLGFESAAAQRAAPRGKFFFPRRRLAVAVCFAPPMCSSIFD